jgi:hypothetical protein
MAVSTVYDTSLAGAIQGLITARSNTSSTAADYDTVADDSVDFATAMLAALPEGGGLAAKEQQLLSGVVAGYFAGHDIGDPATDADICLAIYTQIHTKLSA